MTKQLAQATTKATTTLQAMVATKIAGLIAFLGGVSLFFLDADVIALLADIGMDPDLSKQIVRYTKLALIALGYLGYSPVPKPDTAAKALAARRGT